MPDFVIIHYNLILISSGKSLRYATYASITSAIVECYEVSEIYRVNSLVIVHVLRGGRGGGEIFEINTWVQTLYEINNIYFKNCYKHVMERTIFRAPPNQVEKKYFFRQILDAPPPRWGLNGGPIKLIINVLVRFSRFIWIPGSTAVINI